MRRGRLRGVIFAAVLLVHPLPILGQDGAAPPSTPAVPSIAQESAIAIARLCGANADCTQKMTLYVNKISGLEKIKAEYLAALKSAGTLIATYEQKGKQLEELAEVIAKIGKQVSDLSKTFAKLDISPLIEQLKLANDKNRSVETELAAVEELVDQVASMGFDRNEIRAIPTSSQTPPTPPGTGVVEIERAIFGDLEAGRDELDASSHLPRKRTCDATGYFKRMCENTISRTEVCLVPKTGATCPPESKWEEISLKPTGKRACWAQIISANMCGGTFSPIDANARSQRNSVEVRYRCKGSSQLRTLRAWENQDLYLICEM